MKYLIWLIIGLGVWWWLRQQRHANLGSDKLDSDPNFPKQQTMVPCAQCGVHVPQGDAVRGARGWYCSEAHRLAREG